MTSQWTYDMCNRVTPAWQLTALACAGSVSLFPLFQENRVLPLKCWYPFDFTVSPYYEIVYLSQSLVQLVMPLSFCVTMTIPIGMAFLVCGQYDLLCCSVKNLPWAAIRYASTETDSAVMLKYLLVLISWVLVNKYGFHCQDYAEGSCGWKDFHV